MCLCGCVSERVFVCERVCVCLCASYLRVDSNKGISLGVKLLLQGDDDGLEVQNRLILDVVRHLVDKQSKDITVISTAQANSTNNHK